jgi:hypothetical protein
MTNPATKATAIAAILLLAAVLAWALSRPPAPPPSVHAVPVAAEEPAAVKPTAGSRPPSAELAGLPAGPFNEIATELEALATAGNAAAAYRLADILGTCPSEPVPSRDGFADQLVEGLAAFGSGFRFAGMQSHEPGVIEILLAAHDHVSSLCDGVDGLDPLTAREEARQWMAQAAALGYPPALLVQADALIGIYRTRGDIIENAEGLRDLRRQAMGMLQRALDAGEPKALARMSRAAATGDLAPRDPVAAYGYMLAFRDVPERFPVPRAVIDTRLQTLAAPLSDAQRRHAEALAAHWLQRPWGGY